MHDASHNRASMHHENVKSPSRPIIMRNRTRPEGCEKRDYEKYVIACIVLPLKATVFAYPTTVKIYWGRLIMHRISPGVNRDFDVRIVIYYRPLPSPPLPSPRQSDEILLSQCT